MSKVKKKDCCYSKYWLNNHKLDGTYDMLTEYIHDHDKKTEVNSIPHSEDKHFDIVVYNMENPSL